MSLTKNIIPIGNNYNLSAYQEDGIFIHRSPIPEIQPFHIIGVQAMRLYEWNMGLVGFDFVPLALFAYKTTGFTSALDLNISIKDFAYNTLQSFNLNGAINVVGNSLYYQFPQGSVVSKNHIVVLSTDTAIDSLVINCQKCFYNNPISPHL